MWPCRLAVLEEKGRAAAAGGGRCIEGTVRGCLGGASERGSVMRDEAWLLNDREDVSAEDEGVVIRVRARERVSVLGVAMPYAT